MLNKYLKSNEELFLKWESICTTDDLVTDGIVSPSVWFEEKGERILFLLKEAYSKKNPTSWNLTKWLYHEDGEICMQNCAKNCSSCFPSGATYNHVAEAAYMILNPEKDFDEWLGAKTKSKHDYYIARAEVLKRIAVVNIKKFNGNKNSNHKNLVEELNPELIKKQIEIINPTIIICGGTYCYLKAIFNLNSLENEYNGSTTFNGIKVVATIHPCKRMNSRKKAEDIFSLYKK